MLSSDSRITFGLRIQTYVFVGYISIIAILLLAGETGKAWPNVLTICLIQCALSIGLSILLGRKNLFVPANIGLSIVNWLAAPLIVVTLGGYPTPLWVIFLIGIFPASFFLGWRGVLINTATAALALLLPSWSLLNTAIITGVGSQTLTILIVGLIANAAFQLLLKEENRRKKVENALQNANEKLTTSLMEQKRQTVEKTLLNEMGDMLQACNRIEEMYGIINHYGNRLFPIQDGALFLYNAPRDSLEPALAWGGLSYDQLTSIAPNKCWALRRGQIHQLDKTQDDLRCFTCLKDKPQVKLNGTMCVPMMAHGETLGVLYTHDADTNEEARLPDRHLTTISVAKQVALAIGNIKLRETLHSQSIRDPLTHLYNRRYLEETLNRETHRAVRRQTPLSIVMLDLDYFKIINDRYGHEAGDTALMEIGNFLNTRTRSEDIACRYGGEEFIVIFPDMPLHSATQRAEDLRIGIEALSIQHRGALLEKITVSIGVAAIPEFEAANLIEIADAALYQAKSEGRNKVVTAHSNKMRITSPDV